MTDRAAYREQIEALAEEAERSPGRYRLHVIGLVLQGYATLLGLSLGSALLGLAVIVLAGLARVAVIGLKLGLPLLGFSILVARSTWVRLPAPGGWPIERRGAPELFRVIDEVRERIGAPRPDHVLMTADFNAGIVQIPRLGPLGFASSYLLLGLPLLEALSPDEMRAVLAHEFGHLSGRHGWFGAWIYRLRQTWSQLAATVRANVLRNFATSFVPRFDAATFVLARRQEVEADRAAAELAGARTTGAALVRIRIVATFLEASFWPSLARRVATEAEPPSVGDELVEALRRGPDPDEAKAWLARALERPTDLDDTHPSLADRLASIGVRAEETGWEDGVAPSAAMAWLGASRGALLTALNDGWHGVHAERWKHDHAVIARERTEWDALRERAALGALGPDERWRLGLLTARFEGPRAALAYVEDGAKDSPDRADRTLYLGWLRLQCEDESGLELVRGIVEREPALAVEECEAAYQFLFSRGRIAEADAWHARASRCQQARARGSQERSTLTPGDAYEPHGLPDEVIAQVRTVLAKIGGHDRAYLVRKRLAVLPTSPCWVLGVHPDFPFWTWNPAAETRRLLGKLTTSFPMLGETIFAVLGPQMKWAETKLAGVEGATILGSKPR